MKRKQGQTNFPPTRIIPLLDMPLTTAHKNSPIFGLIHERAYGSMPSTRLRVRMTKIGSPGREGKETQLGTQGIQHYCNLFLEWQACLGNMVRESSIRAEPRVTQVQILVIPEFPSSYSSHHFLKNLVLLYFTHYSGTT